MSYFVVTLSSNDRTWGRWHSIAHVILPQSFIKQSRMPKKKLEGTVFYRNYIPVVTLRHPYLSLQPVDQGWRSVALHASWLLPSSIRPPWDHVKVSNSDLGM